MKVLGAGLVFAGWVMICSQIGWWSWGTYGSVGYWGGLVLLQGLWSGIVSDRKP